MIDGIIYLLGAAIALVGLLGILALATAWAIDQVLKLTGLSKVIVSWYVDRLQKERDAKRIPG